MSDQIEQTEPQLNVIAYNPIFPILTGSVLLDLPVEDMAEDILKMSNNQSNCTGGYSSLYSSQSIENIRGISEMRQAIYGISCAIGRELKYETDYEKSSINLWFDVMRRGNYHVAHNQPRSVFSGTFIVRSDTKMSPIVLINPNLSNRMHDPFIRNEDLGPFTADAIIVEPKVNVLNIWPSWLQYQMPEMTEPGPRISFGFSIDFLPPGV